MDFIESASSNSSCLLKMLQTLRLDEVIFKQTDLRVKRILDSNGRIAFPKKVIEVFDQELQEFVSKYLRNGFKKKWLEDTCLVSFNFTGKNKQLVLFASQEMRSKIWYDSFPYKGEFHLDWRVCLTKMNKRPLEELSTSEQPVSSCVTQTPNEKKLCIDTVAPIVERLILEHLKSKDSTYNNNK